MMVAARSALLCSSATFIQFSRKRPGVEPPMTHCATWRSVPFAGTKQGTHLAAKPIPALICRSPDGVHSTRLMSTGHCDSSVSERGVAGREESKHVRGVRVETDGAGSQLDPPSVDRPYRSRRHHF